MLRSSLLSTSKISQTLSKSCKMPKRHFGDNRFNPFDPFNRLDILSPFCPLNPLYKTFEVVDPLREIDICNILHEKPKKEKVVPSENNTNENPPKRDNSPK